MFGLYDTIDKCWLGDEHGPRLWGDELPGVDGPVSGELVARLAAELHDRRMEHPTHRTIPKRYDGTGTERANEMGYKHDGHQMFRRVMRGTLP